LDRIKTGIAGMDELLSGGIPKGSNVLLSGGAGTGKTILAMQYLYNGSMQFGEPGVYVTFEGSVRELAWNMESFKWDLKRLQDNGMLTIYRLNLTFIQDRELLERAVNEQLQEIAKKVEEINAKRLVIDSTTVFGAYMEAGLLRSTLFQFCDRLKNLGCTTMLTSETQPSKINFSAYGVEEFVTDGIIALYFTPPNRSIFIRKMRGTEHSKNPHPLIIDNNGIKINPKDNILWEAIK
jgi:circadian clock protein KaiC